jgi:predicted transcriptional regulator
MGETKLGMVEARFADIVWENAPLTTRQLVNLCQKELNWARTTTYTVLRKLCDRGIFAMNKRQVTVLIPKESFRAMQSEQFVQENFQGSLPAFIAAFTSQKPLTREEYDRLKALVDNYGETLK